MGLLENALKFREDKLKAEQSTSSNIIGGGALGRISVIQRSETGEVISERTEPIKVVTGKRRRSSGSSRSPSPQVIETQLVQEVPQTVQVESSFLPGETKQDLVTRVADTSKLTGVQFITQGTLLGSRSVVEPSSTQVILSRQTVDAGKERARTFKEVEQGVIGFRAEPTERQGLLQMERPTKQRGGFFTGFREGVIGSISADPNVFGRARATPVESLSDAGLLLGVTLGAPIAEVLFEIERPVTSSAKLASEFTDDILRIKTKSTKSIDTSSDLIRRQFDVDTPLVKGTFKKATGDVVTEIVEKPGVTTGVVSGVTFEGKPITGDFFEFQGRQVVSVKKPIGKKQFTVVSDIFEGVEDVKVFDADKLVFRTKRPSAKPVNFKKVEEITKDQFILGEGTGKEFKTITESFSGVGEGTEIGLKVQRAQTKTLQEISPRVETVKRITPGGDELLSLRTTPSLITRGSGDDVLKATDRLSIVDNLIFETTEPRFLRDTKLRTTTSAVAEFKFNKPVVEQQLNIAEGFFGSKKGTLGSPRLRLRPTASLQDVTDLTKRTNLLSEFGITKPFSGTRQTSSGLSGLTFLGKIGLQQKQSTSLQNIQNQLPTFKQNNVQKLVISQQPVQREDFKQMDIFKQIQGLDNTKAFQTTGFPGVPAPTQFNAFGTGGFGGVGGLPPVVLPKIKIPFSDSQKGGRSKKGIRKKGKGFETQFLGSVSEFVTKGKTKRGKRKVFKGTKSKLI